MEEVYTSTSMSPSLPAAGSKFDLTTQVCNGGSAPHRRDTRKVVGVFLTAPSKDWVPSCNDVPDATVGVPAMGVFKLPAAGMALLPVPLKAPYWPCASVTFKQLTAPADGAQNTVVALRSEVRALALASHLVGGGSTQHLAGKRMRNGVGMCHITQPLIWAWRGGR